MASLDGQKTLKALLKKGFRKAAHKSKDHKYVEFWYNGKLTEVYTKFSHNNQDLDDYLIKKVSSQIRLNKNNFMEFAECTFSEAQYINELKIQKILLD